jgi:hypothetical protein
MESRSFSLIENRISPAIQQVTKDILLENLVEEARLAMEKANNSNGFMLWKQWIDHKDFALAQSNYPLLDVSFDMGWQHRSSGVRYNSLSGHALLVGALTRKPICLAIKSKRCNFCITWKSNNKDIVEAAELDGEELMIPCGINAHRTMWGALDQWSHQHAWIWSLICLTITSALSDKFGLMMMQARERC